MENTMPAAGGKMEKRKKLVQIAFLLLRVVVGLIFIENGGLKLFGWFGGIPGGNALPPLMIVAGILEFFGGLAILLGFLIRPIAFLLAGEMAIAYFIGHASKGHFFVPLANQGQPAVLLSFISLFFAAYGPGPLSLGGLIWRKKHQAMNQAPGSN